MRPGFINSKNVPVNRVAFRMIKNIGMPYVIQKTANGERSYDIFSRLLENRIIMLDSEINEQVGSVVCAELLYLESRGDEDIMLCINNPGGAASAGLAIHDTLRHISRMNVGAMHRHFHSRKTS
jgi:ATP-dependent Clp endopeptidase proteolytic subunit ClpP